MPLLLVFSFLAGLVTIMAPCIWPLLPIILSASVGEGKRRPIGITLGIMTSFTFFTLSVAYLEKTLHIDPDIFRSIAVVIILAMGLMMLFPALALKFEGLVARLLSPLQGRIKARGTGFGAGYVTGFSTGMVWAPCAGPILAAVATLAATQAVNVKVVMITLAYVAGLGVPLFAISLLSAWLAKRLGAGARPAGYLRRAFGVVMIAAALLIYTNYDKTLQVKILDKFPAYGKLFERVEKNDIVAKELDGLLGKEASVKPAAAAKRADLSDLGPAPEFAGITHWLNVPEPLTLRSLRGKVVLVDFWTYTCINCVRTLPHLTGWYEKYKDTGLVIVGVHAPEFAFEKKTANVEQAIRQFKVHYPVAQDNDFRTWRAYDNRYWPAEYLIDARGHIRKKHFGEGRYGEMERAIRALLNEAGYAPDGPPASLADAAPRQRQTPETYLGKSRMARFASREKVLGGRQSFTLGKDIALNHFAYQGVWDISGEAARADKGSALTLNFRASKVFLVVSPAQPGDRVKVFLDGRLLSGSAAGADVKDGELTFDRQRLYAVVDLKGKDGQHLLRLEFQNSGDTVFAFTFG